MRGFENHEVPRGIFEQPSARLHSLRRPVAGLSYICAERLSLAGVVHLPSIWDSGSSLTPRCNCPDSLQGWCKHTMALAALWMKRPWTFDTEEAAPTTPIGTLEPCRRSSPGLDRLERFLDLALVQGLTRAPLAAELSTLSGLVLTEGLDRMATRLSNCSRLSQGLRPDTEPGVAWEVVEHLLEAMRAADRIRRLMTCERVVESVHDEWLGSITGIHSSMPIRHRRYLELGRARYSTADGTVVLKRYWVDLASGEVVSDEQPEDQRVALEEGAQVLRLRRAELHPGFMPRWLEALQGQEEPAGATEVGEALDHFLHGNAAVLGAWRKRLGLDQAPEDWVGGITGISLARSGDDVLLHDDRHGAPLLLGGPWPAPDDLPQGVSGAFGRLVVTPRGPAFFPLSLLTGEEVLLGPLDLLFPHPRLVRQGLGADEDRALDTLLQGLLQGLGERGRWSSLLAQLDQAFPAPTRPAQPAAAPPSTPSTAALSALWSRVREQIMARVLS